MIKVLLIDDDKANSMLLKRYLEVEGFDARYAADGSSGLEIYSSFRPDIILLDINMPGIDGFEVARHIREKDNDTLIFFLTDRTEKIDRLHGFTLRANDYIPKPFYPEELVMRIRERCVAIGASSQRYYTIGNTVLDTNLSTVTCGKKVTPLSARQSQILEMLAARCGDMVAREEILQAIWGNDSYANSLALNVQITYLRRILSADPTLEIASIRRRGYLLKTL